MCDKIVCPTCGSELNGDKSEMRALMGLRIATMPKAVLRELIEVWPGSLTTDKLVWLLYQGTDEPEYSRTNVHVFVNRLRKAINGTGWTVVNRGGKGGGTNFEAQYTLERCPR